MSDFLVPLLFFALLVVFGWALRQRSLTLQWRETEQQAILDALEDAVLTFDRGGQLIYSNPTARVWFGLDGTKSYDIQALSTKVSPYDGFAGLFSQNGRASLRIGARTVEAVSRQVNAQGVSYVTLLLRDVPASQALPLKEGRRTDELAVFDEINEAVNATSNLDELLDNVLHKLKHLFPYTSGAISLWNPRTQQLAVRCCIGPTARHDEAIGLDRDYATQIVQDREPLLVKDASPQNQPERTALIRSYAGAPLLVGTKFVGTLELASDQANTFSTEDLDALRIIASHLAVAIENTRLHSETLLRAEEAATMNTLSAAINVSLNLDELLEIIVYSVSQAIGSDRSAVFLMDSNRGTLSLGKSRGLSEAFIRRNQNIEPVLDGPGQVVLDRYPLVVSDINQVQTPTEVVSLLKREGISAFVDLPLRGREQVLGALTVYYDRPHAFDESELELLQTIANQVTLALENARLYERTDRALARRVDQLAAIEEIGRELTSTLDTTRVFNVVLQRAMGTTGASAGFLAVCDANCDELELIVDSGYSEGTLERYWKEGWPITNGIVRHVARTGETALVNDVHADPDYVALLPDTCARLTVPIVKEARVLGVVSLESSRSQGFSPDDVRFTTQVAELAAIAIENARLFQQVREGRDNLQAILDSTYEGILVIGRDNRVVLANPMIEEWSGLSARDLVGQHVSTLVAKLGTRVSTLLGFSPSELEEVVSLLDATSDKVTKRTFEMLGPPTRYIEQVASPVFDKDSGVVGRLVVFRDITEERRLALMRQDTTDMIIHDLRSPLTAVIGGVQVASDLIESSADTSVIHHALDMANQSCNHLMSLVDSLLDISRLEAGQMPLERNPVLLPQLAQSTIHRMKPLAERATVALELKSTHPIPPVYADFELISRVLVNLIDNALKHSPKNGVVSVEIIQEPFKAASTHKDGDGVAMEAVDLVATVRCAVVDMGPGIAEEYRQRVFERFAQLDGRRRGKGLGLAFCQLAVQAHGGRIWVEDNPRGRGSAFIFTLPAVPSELFLPNGSDSFERASR